MPRASLADFVAARGFVPVAAAAFVGEHSYSTARWPIAAGRPDGDDCAEAEAFGRVVAAKLAAGGVRAIDAKRLPTVRNGMLSMWRFVRFVLGYRRSQKRHPQRVAVETSADRCTHCGRCVKLCPTGAIVAGDEPSYRCGEVYPLLCLRQGMSRRRTQLRFSLRTRAVA